MNMKKSTSILMAVFIVSLSVSAQTWQPADPDATPEAKQLFTRLLNIQSKGIMYGHQDDLMTGHTWWYEPGRSDTKEAVGDYPAVAGFELGEIELGGTLSLDSVAFANMAERVRWFYGQNGMAKNFLQWRDEKGVLIPFIFRPYHEHSGSFFWWGTERCYAEEYAALWRYTVNFLREKGLHNILYAYNTDKVYSAEEYLSGYPGDEYIDMLSIDWYGQGEEFNKNIDKALEFTTQIAEQKQKLHALSECGPISADLQRILAQYKTSYVLTWRNAPPRGGKKRFVPLTAEQIAQLPADARTAYENRLKQPKHEDLLKLMKANKRYLFLKDIQNIK